MSETDLQELRSKWGVLAIGVLVVVLALVISQVYTLVTLAGVQSKVAGIESEHAKSHALLASEMARLRDHSASEAADSLKRLESLREEMTLARLQAQGAVGRAKQDALRSAKELEAKLAAEEKKLGEQHAQVTSQLSDLKQSATTAHAKISDVNADVSSVKAEVASTKSELNRTVADLRKTVGDLGVMSGLIATNSKEIAALKALGDRNYFEFTLAKQPQAVSNIRLVLKKTDVKRHRYTVDVLTEDRKIEKKDKTVNEPVQFFVNRNRQPCELVINEVRKDQIAGYLATPKISVETRKTAP